MNIVSASVQVRVRCKSLLVSVAAALLGAATAVSAQPLRNAPAYTPPPQFELPSVAQAAKPSTATVPLRDAKLRPAVFRATPSKATTARLPTPEAYALGIAQAGDDSSVLAYLVEGRSLSRYTVDKATLGKPADDKLPLAVTASDSIDLAVPAKASVLAGVTLPAGIVLVLDGAPGAQAIRAVDAKTGIEAAKLPLKLADSLVGLAWHPERQSLYTLSVSGDELLELNPADATVLGRWPLAPAGTAAFSAGLGDIEFRSRSGLLWVVGDGEARIREFTAQGEFVRDLSYAGFVEDQNGKIDTATGIAAIRGSREIWMSGYDGIYRFDPEAPVIESFKAEVLNGKTTLKWKAQNADSCVAADGWAGNKKLKGDEAVQAVGGDAKDAKTTFTLVCSRDDQKDSRSVAVPNAIENGVLGFDASSINVLESDGNVSVTVSRTGDSVGAVSVQYATQDSSAQAGLDYSARSGTLNWANGEVAPKTITVPILDDNLVDPSEAFYIVLSNPGGGAALGNPNAYVTIQENGGAGALQFSAGSQQISEAAGTVTVAVSRTRGSRGAVSVAYATEDNNALAGSDYAARSGTLNWADGDVAPKTFSVPITDDNVTEGDESFYVRLSNPSNGALLGYPELSYITLNESTASAGYLQFSASSQQVSEAAGTVTVAVSRTRGSRGAVSVAYATEDSSALAGSDYTARSGTLNWADGDVAPKTFAVPIVDDNVTEGDEAFFVRLSGPTNGAQLGSPETSYITLNESTASAGYLQFSASSQQVSEAAGTVTVAVSRTRGSRGAVSVAYATEDSSALAGSDYTARSGTLNWADGDVAPKTFTVPLIDDNTTEGDEAFYVRLSSPSNGAQLGSPEVSYITLNESTASAGYLQFSASNYSTREVAGNVTVSVSRVRGSRGAVSVAYATQDSSAQAGSDYTARSGTLNWADGELTPKTFTVPVLGDSIEEGDESFQVTLSNPSGSAQLGSPATSNVTLVENLAGAGRLGFNQDGYSVSETGGNLTVTVLPAVRSTGAVSVDYATSDYQALAGSDYTARSGTLNWAAGDVAPKTFTVPISNDNVPEGDENFYVQLSNPTGGAALGTSFAWGYIIESTSGGRLGFAQDGYSVSETGGNLTVTVLRTAGSTGTVSVDYATSDYQALAGSDYTARSGTLNWAAGDVAPKTFTVPISNDNVPEGDENFYVQLSNPTGGAALGTSFAWGYIIESTSGGRLSFMRDSYVVAESGGSATLTVQRLGGSAGEVSIVYATQNNSAQAGTDYGAQSGTLTWADGDLAPKNIVVPILNDSSTEGDENFYVNLSNPSNGAQIGNLQNSFVTIREFASAGVVQFNPAGYTVNENGGSVTLTATRTGGSSGAVAVSYATQNSSALAGSDYTSRSGTLSWASGDVAPKTFSVPILVTAGAEPDELFLATLSNPTNGLILGGSPTAYVTITEPQNPGTVQLSASSYSVNEGGGNAVITLTRNDGSFGAASVVLATSNGTATAGADYTAVTQTVNWANGDATAKTVSIPVIQDTTDEPDETLSLTLSNVGGATLGSPASATLTILDDDESAGFVQLSASSYSVDESGGNAVITVTRSGGAAGAASVRLATSNGTATAGSDYTAVTQTLNWANGDAAAKTVSIPITQDTTDEPNETVNLTLSNVSGATLGSPATGVLTVVDDDNPAGGSLQFSAASYSAGEGAGNAVITVTRTDGSFGAASVRVATSNGTAAAGSDYSAVTQTLNWADGDTAAKTVSIPVTQDTTDDPDETVNLTLSNISGATLGSPSSAVLSLVDDDNAPAGSVQLSATNYSVSEAGGNAVITLTRSGGSFGAASVNLATSNGIAIAGSDYTARNVTVNWADGDSAAKTVSIAILQDTADEPDETVHLTLGSASGASLGSPATAVLTIIDDDDAPAGSVQLSAASYSAGEAAGNAVITLTRTGGSFGAASVLLATSNGSATAGADYTATTATVSWADGDAATKTVNIPVLQDSTDEPNETVNLALSAVTGAALGSPATGVLTIVDDDDAPAGSVQLSAASYSAGEAAGNAVVTLTRTGGSFGAASVRLNTSNGTATTGADYTATSVTVNWTDGDAAAKTVSIPVIQDATDEPDETVNLALGSVTGATLGTPATALLTIVDDDNPPAGSVQLSAATYSAGEAAGNAVITLTRSGGSFGAASVLLATSNGTATAGADYTATTTTVSWIDGDTAAKTVSISVIQDPTDEPNETVNLALSAVSGATLGSPATGVLTIVDDDNPPAGSVQLSAASYSAGEASGNALITLTRTDGSFGAASVRLATSNGTATAGSDYTATTATVSWADGDTAAKTVSIPVIQDTTDEPEESVNIALSNVSGATLGSPATAVLTIVDDDNPPAGSVQFNASSYSAGEAAGTAIVTVTRTGGSFGDASVRVTTSNGTATAASDYTATTRTVTWTDGDTAAKTVSIPVLQDAVDEPNETVNLALSDATGATVGSPAAAVLTVVDDDDAPAGSVALSSATYSAGEAAGNALITLTRTGGSFGAASVRLATSNGTATAGADYTATSVIVNWTDGDAAAKTVSVPVIQDSADEPNETVSLALSGVTGATLGSPATAVLTIVDDDDAPSGSVQLSTATYSAGEAAGNAVITLTRTGGSFGAASVTVATSNGTATAGGDYTATTASVNWANGDSAAKTVSIPVIQDPTDEPDETVNIALSNVTGATLGTPATAVLTVIDDDPTSGNQPTVSIAPIPSVNEGGPGVAATFTLSEISSLPVTVRIGFAGTAANLADFQRPPSTVTIRAGTLSSSITLVPIDDDLVEGSEAATVSIVSAVNARVGTSSSSTLTVIDNESPTVSIQPIPAVNEGGAAVAAVFTLSAPTNVPVTLRLTFSGAAANARDFRRPLDTVTIPAGQLSASITLTPVDDTVAEASEQATVTIMSATNARIGNGSSTVTVIDND